ncbi:hypothetical protein ABZW11_30975 [Nonomuraea sp. NPDC004580]
MIDHYRALFERHQWLRNALCWTVVFTGFPIMLDAPAIYGR